MFNEIIGNDEIKDELIKTINLNKISHSYFQISWRLNQMEIV